MTDQLFPYGIQNEKSSIRAHVCVRVGIVYVFETKYGVSAIENGSYPCLPAYTGAQVTAMGHIVPPDGIHGIMGFNIPNDLKNEILPLENSTTSAKGEGATRIVKEMMKRGLLAMPIILEDETSPEAQIEGNDLIVSRDNKIQVKCDWKGGTKTRGGTGNLYLQIAESNPNKAY